MPRPRLNWFTPLPPARTDVANFTLRLLPELRERFDLHLWTDQARLDQRAVGPDPVHRFEPRNLRPVVRELNRADLTCFNLGNHATFHGGIWRTMRAHGGIAILHDGNLHQLFERLYREQPEGDQTYLDALTSDYGPEAKSLAAAFLSGRVPVDRVVEAYPWLGRALRDASGVIVHNRGLLAGGILPAQLPVLYSALPYGSNGPARPSRTETPTAYSPTRCLRLIAFGHFGGTNRRLEAIVEALGSFRHRDCLRLDVLGVIDHPGTIRERIAHHGLKERVRLHGYVPEEALERALASADLVLNLRYPSRGEASGSLLRAWSHALPVLVTRTGWYATLPDDSVGFVEPDGERVGLHHHFEACLESPERYRAIGEAGRRHLLHEHTPARYADNLAHYWPELLKGAPSVAVRQLARRTASRLQEVGSACDPANALRRRVAGELADWAAPGPVLGTGHSDSPRP